MGGGGPCDFSVSPSPFGLDFGTLDFGLGLDNKKYLMLCVGSIKYELKRELSERWLCHVIAMFIFSILRYSWIYVGLPQT